MRENNAGFSLIELMVVICLVALIITLGALNTRFLQKAVAQSEIDLLYNTCVALQHTAMATNQTQELFFDEVRQIYSHNGNEHHLSNALRLGTLPNIKGPPSSPHALLASPVTFLGNAIQFHPDGVMSAGTVYLVDAYHNQLYAISSSVAHISHLRIYRYDGKWQLL